jgi:adenosylcobinamide-GDP ribazoletransferase
MKKIGKQLLFAYGFLTIIPGLGKIRVEPEDMGKSTLFYPVVGFTAGAGLYFIGLLRDLHPFTQAVIMVVYLLLISRGMHADGLLDTLDGFLSGRRKKDEILQVMRDSRLGALGFTGAFCLYSLKIALLYEILIAGEESVPAFLMAVPALSRSGVALAGFLFPCADGQSGMGKSFLASIGPTQALTSFFLAVLIIGILLSFQLTGFVCLVLAPAASLFWTGWGFICRKKIGGMTGDTLGAGIEMSEVFILILALILCV